MFRLVIVILSALLSFAAGDLTAADDRVVNGRVGSINEFPFLVSIQLMNRHFCGGSILNEQYILTAAHCLVDVINDKQVSALTVRAGSSNSNSGGVVKTVKRAMVHENYNPRNMNYDVALMEINGQFVFSAVLKAAKILATPIPSGQMVEVSGWGQLSDRNTNLPTTLQTTQMSYLTYQDCARMHGRAVTDSMVCAWAPGKDACRGDSGGPLTIAGTNVLAGIVSWGIQCADAGLPGVYANVLNKENLRFMSRYVKLV